MADEIGAYSPKTAKFVLDSVRELSRNRPASSGLVDAYTPTPIYFKNKSTADTIPAYGCVQMVGTEEIDGSTYLLVDKPFDYDMVMGPFLLNGPGEVEPGQLGTAQWGPIYRATKNGGTYSVGTRLGPTASSYDLSKGCLFSYAGNDEQEEDLIKVIACETPLLAVATSGISANSSGTVTAKVPSSGNWTTGTVTYTAWNPTAVAIASAKSVMLFPIDAKWVAVELC